MNQLMGLSNWYGSDDNTPLLDPANEPPREHCSLFFENTNVEKIAPKPAEVKHKKPSRGIY